MKKILLLILVTFVAGNAFGQELGRYIGASTGASGVNPKVTFSGLTRGSGVKRELDAEYFASTEWNSSDMNAAKAANEYHGFSIQPNTTYWPVYTSFSFVASRSFDGPQVVGVGFSTDGGLTWLNSPNYNLPDASTDYIFTWNLVGISTLNTVILRVYGWSALGTGFLKTKDFVVNGSVAMPEINLVGGGNNIVNGAVGARADNNTYFGNQNVPSGTTVKTYTIQNLGGSQLSLTGTPLVAIAGVHAGDFSVTAQPTTPITANGTTTFQITFDPSAVGARKATVSIANNDGDENPYTFEIEGQGTVSAALISVSGNSIDIPYQNTSTSTADNTDFGNQNVASGGTVVRNFSIKNSGTIQLNLTGTTITGAHASDFTVSAGASGVGAGAATNLTITFKPSAVGTRTATVNIGNTDSTKNPFTFAIQGTGIDVPGTPTGTISGATPSCGPAVLTYNGAIPVGIIYYFQNSPTGTSRTYSAVSTYNALTTGTYYVRAYSGGVWSTGASTGYAVTVNTPVNISSQPNTATLSVCAGATFTNLNVGVTGSSLTYQWYKSTDNSNATPADDITVGTSSSSYTPLAEVGTFYYYVIVSGGAPCTSVKSNISGARTTYAKPVTPQGTITRSTNCGTITLTYNFAAGESTDGNSYYWQTSANGTSTTYNVISSTYTLNTTGTRYIRSRNSLGCWSDSISQTFTIYTIPTITTQPVSQTIAAGGNVTFSINNTSFVKQWQVSTDSGATWSNIGTDSGYLTVNSVTFAQNQNRYKVIVTNGLCAVESNVAILTVTNTAPNNTTGFYGCFLDDSVTLRWNAPLSGTPPTGYVIFARQGSALPTGTKADASTYVANSNFTAGVLATPNTLGKVVYKGNATEATITGLVENGNYSFEIFPYVNENLTAWASGAAGGRITNVVAQDDITNLISTAGARQVTLNWTNNLPNLCWDQMLIVANQGPVVFTPTGDGSDYEAIQNEEYSSPNQVLYASDALISNKTIFELTNDLQYCFKIYLRRGMVWSDGVSTCATPALNYCSVAGTMTYQTSVTNVTLNTLNHNSGKLSGYANNLGLTPTILQRGASYDLSISVNTAGNNQVYSRAWIDWNQDGDFNDFGEDFDLGNAQNTANGVTNGSPLAITVPTTALIGNTRMRVSARNGQYANPCLTGYDGEIEDYTINIIQVSGAEIYVKGNNQNIASGSTTPSALNETIFDAEIIGTTSTPKTYTIGNIGLSDLILSGNPRISLLGVNPGDFTITQNPDATIASGASSTFAITFTPSQAGTRTAIVSINNNDSTDSESPYTFLIQGTGKAPEIDVQSNGISIASGSIAVGVANNTHFGTAQITGGLVTKTFSILNTGTDVLTLSNPQISGSSDFTITANPANSVAIGGNTTFTVTFDPATTGEKNAIIRINNNDLNENPYTFAIRGSAINYIECSPGATKTWNGTNWLDASNAIATPPTSSEIAIINADYSTASGNLSGCKCEINPGVTLTVVADSFMVIQSELKNEGTVIVENNACLVQVNDFAVNTGAITYKRISRDITRYDYLYWSSPVEGFSLHDVSPNTLADKYFSWNNVAQDWKLERNGAVTMQKGLGYIARGSQSFTTGYSPNQTINAAFQGVPNNGIIEIAGVGAGLSNFLGNPYPSAIEARVFLDPSINPHLEGTIYLWTHNTAPVLNPATGRYEYTANDYAVYNLSGSTVTQEGAEILNHYIASGQAFFADGASQGPIVFNNGMRVIGDNAQFLRNQNPRNADASESQRNRIWLNLKNTNDGFSQILVGYLENATNSYDRFYDGKVFGGTSVSLYSVSDNIDLTIQAKALPFDVNDKVNLGYRATLTGSHTISIDHVDGLFTGNQNIYLEDKLLHIIHNLKNGAYTFTTATGTFNNRFVLRYTSENLSNPDFDTIKNAVIVSVKNKAITVNSSLENIKGITVYDLLGRTIYDNKKVNAKDFTIPEANAPQQALVVKILLDNGMETNRKVILN